MALFFAVILVSMIVKEGTLRVSFPRPSTGKGRAPGQGGKKRSAHLGEVASEFYCRVLCLSLLSGHPRTVGKRQGLQSPEWSAWCIASGRSINVSSEKGTGPQSGAPLPAAGGESDAALTPEARLEEALWLLRVS